MTFRPGQSGDRLGSRNKKTLAVEAQLFEHAQELVDDLVRRAKRGEPAAMRLAMERILPTGRGRPLPIELPPVTSAADAQGAADVIMEALKDGTISARETVDLLRVVDGLIRLNGAIASLEKVARREVGKAAQTLEVDHFFPGPPAAKDELRPPDVPRAQHSAERWAAAHLGEESLQIVADSDDAGRRVETG